MISFVILHAAQQLTGINAIFYYSNSFFEGIVDNPLVCTILVGTTNVAATSSSSAWARRAAYANAVQRRRHAGLDGEVVILAQLGYLPDTVAVFGVMAFVTSFEIGLGPKPWLIVADIFDAKGDKREIRGNGKAWVKVCAVLDRVARGVLFCKKKMSVG